VIGGHSDGEMFSPKEKLSEALGPNTTETCNTYNMLKLTRHLFCWDPKAEYVDYYERALYNHILASQNPETGMMCYYVPLRSGSRRNFNTPTESFWCCTGTGVENHAKYGDSIYFHDDSNLYVDLFIASELAWKNKGLKLRQETAYPDEHSAKLVFTCDSPVELTLQVRHPFWATNGFEIRVNGSVEIAAEDARGAESPRDFQRFGARNSGVGSFAAIKRTWKTGDTVEVSMPFAVRVEAFRDNPDRFAFLNGPLVLAAEVDTRKPFPAIVADKETAVASLKPVAGKPNTLAASGEIFRIPGESGNRETLEPFYKLYNQRYETYWDRFTPQQWEARQEDYRKELARQKEIEGRTVDLVNAGEEQNERDHNQKGENTETRDFNDRTFRFANTNGWFSWELKVLPGQPQELSVALFGGGRGGTGYEIFVDDTKIATERLGGFGGNARGQPPEPKVYPLAPELLKDKEKIVLKFKTPADMRGGSVSNVRVLKSTQETSAK